MQEVTKRATVKPAAHDVIASSLEEPRYEPVEVGCHRQPTGPADLPNAGREDRSGAGRREGGSRRPVVGMMAAGFGITALAVTLAMTVPRSRPRTVSVLPVASTAVVGYPQVGVARQTYEPGHTSGWHVHPGMHSVVVLSGNLTIYDGNCQRTDYGAGDVYLGGSMAHLARNEGPDAAEMVVTYIFATSSTVGPGSPVSPPVGCDVS